MVLILTFFLWMPTVVIITCEVTDELPSYTDMVHQALVSHNNTVNKCDAIVKDDDNNDGDEDDDSNSSYIELTNELPSYTDTAHQVLIRHNDTVHKYDAIVRMMTTMMMMCMIKVTVYIIS